MLTKICEAAKVAQRQLAVASTAVKNSALEAIAKALVENSEYIIGENKIDLENAKGVIKDSMLDRLMLDEKRIKGISDAISTVIALDDPVGKTEYGTVRPNGLEILKKKVPLGVIGIIFEARPNVTVDAAVLCLKSGNAAVLRGGKEAIRSNLALAKIMREAISLVGLSPDCINLIDDTSRETSNAMMKANGLIDVLIPRGGAGLIKSVVQNATVPVIETGLGNCHVFVDESANLDMAAQILYNAKCSRPSVCNAAETLLVHSAVAEEFLPMAYEKLSEKSVEIRGDEVVKKILGDTVVPATEEDFATEFDDYIISIGVVNSLDEAITHIRKYSTGHSEAIVTDSYENQKRFVEEIDAAAVYVNASTRFTDGGEFGLGAEIGISTQKLHTRGPMGLNDLTTVKYVVLGNGQIR